MEYNHNRSFDDFTVQLDTIRGYGFNPIGVSQMMLEDVYIFETEKEAWEGYCKIELDNAELCGWWYSKDDFLKAVDGYEADTEYKVKVYWI